MEMEGEYVVVVVVVSNNRELCPTLGESRPCKEMATIYLQGGWTPYTCVSQHEQRLHVCARAQYV